MNKQQLANKIWESANKMRAKIEANEYKDFILGFIFYKYLSEYEVSFLIKNDYSEADIKALSEDDDNSVQYIRENIGYFIAHEHLFSTWINKGNQFNESNVLDALSAFDRLINDNHKKLFKGIFDTLHTGLSKLGDSALSRTKSISDLLYLIKDIPMDGKQGYDVLGFIYEYLIEKFAANAGKKAGEFYTPHEVSLLMSEIVANHLSDQEQIEIYDPTSGSGSLLINIGQCVAKHMTHPDNIKYYAQELKQNTYNLTRMNLVMRGILANNIVTRNGDTLEDDWPYFDENDPVNSYKPLYVDAVVSNPPYSQEWNPNHKDADPRYSRFGLAPKSKADYAFLLHDLYHLKPQGIMTIVLPHGVLFRGGEEGQIRRNLIENNHIDAIIGLPANIFFGTGIPTTIMVLKQSRTNTDVQIIDASRGFAKVGKQNQLRASDIKRISDTLKSRLSIDKYARVVSLDEIRANDYNLNIPRYVDSSPPAETWDIYATMFGGIPNHELDALAPMWQAFAPLRDELFRATTSEHVLPAVDNLKHSITTHSQVHRFIAQFETGLSHYRITLKTALLDAASVQNAYDGLHIPQLESQLAAQLFSHMVATPLIDPYNAYQMFYDEWQTIAADMEMIQTEGFAATRQVDPNMVIKKKNGKDAEVQEGWLGHILPFELVQSHFFADHLAKISQTSSRLADIKGELDSLLEELGEETNILNEANDAFANAEVLKRAKQIQTELKQGAQFDPEASERKILQAAELMIEEKTLKATLKTAVDALHGQTKTKIEQLTDTEILTLLEAKWLDPIMSTLAALPTRLVQDFAAKVQALADKYATTLVDTQAQIRESEQSLAALMGELTGSEYDMQGINELKKLLGGV